MLIGSDHPRFGDRSQWRGEEVRREVTGLLDAAFRTRSADDWVAAFVAADVWHHKTMDVNEVVLGLGRIVPLYYRSSTLYEIC